MINMSGEPDWRDTARAWRMGGHALGLVAVYIASEAGLKIWVERLYTLSVVPNAGTTAAEQDSPQVDLDETRGWRRTWKRSKRLLAEGLQAMLVVCIVLAGVLSFGALVIGAMWTNETVLVVVAAVLNFIVAAGTYDVTLGLIFPTRPASKVAGMAAKIPLVRQLAFPLESLGLATATLGLLYIGTDTVIPLAAFAYVTTVLSRPQANGNTSMRRHVTWLVFFSVIVPAVILTSIQLPAWFPAWGSPPSPPAVLQKLVPPEPADSIRWQPELNKFFVQTKTSLLPGTLIAACLRYDWIRSLPTDTPAERAFTGLAPWAVAERAQTMHTAPRPTYRAGMVGMLVGMIMYKGLELFVSPETIKMAPVYGMFFIPPFVLAAVSLSVLLRGEWRTWWTYKEDWETPNHDTAVDHTSIQKSDVEERPCAATAEKAEQTTQ